MIKGNGGCKEVQKKYGRGVKAGRQHLPVMSVNVICRKSVPLKAVLFSSRKNHMAFTTGITY